MHISDTGPDYRGRDGAIKRRPQAWTAYVYSGDTGALVKTIQGCSTKRQARRMADEEARRLDKD